MSSRRRLITFAALAGRDRPVHRRGAGLLPARDHPGRRLQLPRGGRAPERRPPALRPGPRRSLGGHPSAVLDRAPRLPAADRGLLPDLRHPPGRVGSLRVVVPPAPRAGDIPRDAHPPDPAADGRRDARPAHPHRLRDRRGQPELVPAARPDRHVAGRRHRSRGGRGRDLRRDDGSEADPGAARVVAPRDRPPARGPRCDRDRPDRPCDQHPRRGLRPAHRVPQDPQRPGASSARARSRWAAWLATSASRAASPTCCLQPPRSRRSWPCSSSAIGRRSRSPRS